jgi:hypothetical protein
MARRARGTAAVTCGGVARRRNVPPRVTDDPTYYLGTGTSRPKTMSTSLTAPFSQLVAGCSVERKPHGHGAAIPTIDVRGVVFDTLGCVIEEYVDAVGVWRRLLELERAANRLGGNRRQCRAE